MAQPGKLRVYVNVPEVLLASCQPGMDADLTLAEFPDRRFQANWCGPRILSI